jgi:hypothetical protein
MHDKGPSIASLPELNCAATAALKFAQWLRDRYRSTAPIGTVQLLVSPSQFEAQTSPELAVLQKSNRQNVDAAIQEWKRRCREDERNIAILYMAGHGIEYSRERSYVLLEDFGSHPALLQDAVDVNVIRAGMLEDGIAQTQLYFVDACRTDIEALQKVGQLGYGIMLPGANAIADRRCCPVFFSAAPGTSAFGTTGEGTIFSQALIECLDSLAARPPITSEGEWHVTTTSLEESLGSRVHEIAAKAGELQTVVVGGQRQCVQVHSFATPPIVPVSIRLVPDEAQELARAKFSDRLGNCVMQRNPFQPNPIAWNAPAGLYSVDVVISKSTRNLYKTIRKRLFFARPPVSSEEISVV